MMLHINETSHGGVRLLARTFYLYLKGDMLIMTYERLSNIIINNNIPTNVRLMSDSGWECNSTDMNGVYYNRKNNIIVFTQGSIFDEYKDNKEWITLFCKGDN